MKKIFKYSILIFICLITTNVYALDDYSGGSSGSVGSLGSGHWIPQAVGIKVSSVSRSGVVKKSAIFLNSHGKASYMFSSDLNPKMYKSTSVSWVNGASVQTHSLSFLPSKWTTSSGAINNLYDLLTKNNYANLKDIAEIHFYYEFRPGDYLVIEPMTAIGGRYGTAFELANYYGLTSNCSDSSSFCYNYSRVVFRGNANYPNSGVFYNTIYVSTPVLGLTTYSSSNYQDRSNCFMSNTCGRGIGVFGYSDIYDPPCVVNCDPPEEEPETGLSVDVGCLRASITDRNFQTNGNTACTTRINLSNNIGVSKFYAKAGRFLLRKEGNSLYINNSSYQPNPPISTTNGIATATISKSCTISHSTTNILTPNNSKPSFGIQFNGLPSGFSMGSNSFSSSPVYTNTTVTKRCEECVATCYSEFGGSYCCSYRTYDCEWKHQYTYQDTYHFNYNLPRVNLDSITGKAFTSDTGRIEGIISKLTGPNSGHLPFKIKYKGIEYPPTSANDCLYETKPEIITDKLSLEFRAIDTNNPFNRDTKSNWCGTDCSRNNNKVRNYIIDKPNSFGRTSGGGTADRIYTITLNVESIRQIRSYNQNHSYDQNDMTVVRSFLEDMKTRGILVDHTP